MLLSSCSGFIRFAFTSASLLTPAANCHRACSYERGTFRFSCALVTIFLLKGVLSGGASCSTSSSLNLFVSDSFALSFSCCCSFSSEFSFHFVVVWMMYQLVQNIESLTLYLRHLKSDWQFWTIQGLQWRLVQSRIFFLISNLLPLMF